MSLFPFNDEDVSDAKQFGAYVKNYITAGLQDCIIPESKFTLDSKYEVSF